jgi:glycine cleavage system H protein
MNPEDILYHKEHTWTKIEGEKAKIGITDHAQKELGDIVYIELPEIDDEVTKDQKMCDIESTKATSEVISPVSGKVIEVNEVLSDTPEVINEDPYEKGWIVIVEMEDKSENLLEVSDYEKYTEEEAK